MAQDKQQKRIWIEGDALGIVKYINSDEQYLWHYEDIISDIRFSLSHNDETSMHKVLRSANGVTDTMAKWVLKISFQVFLIQTLYLPH